MRIFMFGLLLTANTVRASGLGLGGWLCEILSAVGRERSTQRFYDHFAHGDPMSTCSDNVLLVDLQLDAHVGAGRQSPTKPGGQAIAFPCIRIIAADGEVGRTSIEGYLPALAQIRLTRSSRVIEQPDIGVS